jgi:Sulfotransferase family
MAVDPDVRATTARTTLSDAGWRAVGKVVRLTQQFGAHRSNSTPKVLLEPVFVRLQWGRVGSTLLMQLLATSPEISFDRVYPFENLCLSSLIQYLEPLNRPVEAPKGAWIDDPDRIWWAAPESFGFQISGAPLGYAGLEIDRAAFRLEALRAIWQAYSDSAPWPGGSRPRFYAEKYGGGAEVLSEAGISYRLIDMVRDPRDVWCSVLAFDSKRGYYGFGRHEGQSEEEYLSSFLRAVKRRMDAMAASSPDVPRIVVRYEDLMSDLAEVAGRVGRWLEVRLDPRAALLASQNYSHHKTSDRGSDSVDRWRQELPPEVNERIVDELAEHLDRYGYPRQ